MGQVNKNLQHKDKENSQVLLNLKDVNKWKQTLFQYKVTNIVNNSSKLIYKINELAFIILWDSFKLTETLLT